MVGVHERTVCVLLVPALHLQVASSCAHRLLSPRSSASLTRGSSARCLRARFLFFLVEVTSVFWTLGACCVRTVLGGYLLNGFDDDTYSGITVDTQHLDYQTIALSKVLTCYVHVPPLNPPSPLMGRPGVYD